MKAAVRGLASSDRGLFDNLDTPEHLNLGKMTFSCCLSSKSTRHGDVDQFSHSNLQLYHILRIERACAISIHSRLIHPTLRELRFSKYKSSCKHTQKFLKRKQDDCQGRLCVRRHPRNTKRSEISLYSAHPRAVYKNRSESRMIAHRQITHTLFSNYSPLTHT